MHYDRDSCQKEADVFKALGHPARLWMVNQLADCQEHCVCEFVEALPLEYATVSKHLSVLKNAGVVVNEKRGKNIFYRLSCQCVIGFIACLRNHHPA
jgi:ArsR family transcriptional regulator